MADTTKEEVQSPDKCRCCLQEGELKDLWGEYLLDDGVMVYGQALVECFSLALHQPEDVIEKICVTCIAKLQDATTFKKLVVESDRKMLELYLLDVEVKMDDSEEYSPDGQEVESESSDDDNRIDPEFLEMEVLEAAGSNEPVNTKDPLPKKKQGRNKKYSEEDLNNCIQAVESGIMNKSKAAVFFNVPYKMIDVQLRSKQAKPYENLNAEETMTVKNDISREKYKSFLQEIKTILNYTNATPYKSKTGQISCAYCRKDIDDPDELRSHTRTVHAGERFSGVDVFMRAKWLNEIIKLDIMNLRCTVCPKRIDSWNGMFVHLKEKHNIELDEAYTKVIPYNLTEPLACALCAERCISYTILDTHMNSHYNNYICGDCGDTFLAESRLKKHLETHSTGKFQCPFCPKYFALDKYRKKHVDNMHQQGIIFRCRYCKEEFINEFRRHQHMEKKHSEKIKTITCELCKKVFRFKPYYMKHLRLTHQKDDLVKKFKCSTCDKTFLWNHELKKHEEWHSGSAKRTCLVCNKTFASKQYLEKHYTKAHSDTDVLVLETGEA